MNTDMLDTLDTALERLRAGEAPPDILAEQTDQSENLAALLETATLLQAIRPVIMPSWAELQADRRQFLAEVAEFRSQTVSPGPMVRLRDWIVHNISQSLPNPVYQWKEQRRMSTLLLKATLVFSLIFGSVGGTAVLAANSLPDSPIYPLKLAMEQTRLALTGQPSERAALHLSLARLRTQEMEQLALSGEVPAQATLTQLQHHLNQALKLAAQTPEETMRGLLTQAREMIQTQQQQLAQTQARVGVPAQAALSQAGQLLNRANQAVAEGLQDPQTFRWRYGHGRPPEAPPQPTEEPEPGPNQPVGNPDAPCPTGDCEPVGDEHHYGQEGDKQAVPGEPGGNPDAPCDTDDCEPVSDEHHYGHEPDYHAGPNQPGGGAPTPRCSDGDCEPVGDEHHYGQDADRQAGPGEPGGNPDPACDTGDCEPVGDEHHHGVPNQEQTNGNPDQPAADPGPPPDSDQGNNQNQGNNDNGGGSDDHGNNDSGGDNDGGHNDDSGGGNDNDNGSGDSGGNDNGGGGGNSGGNDGGGGGKK